MRSHPIRVTSPGTDAERDRLIATPPEQTVIYRD